MALWSASSVAEARAAVFDADSENWVEHMQPAEGVDAVTLFEHDRQVYGPMSLHA